MKHVLLIDDEEKLRQLTARIIALEGFEVVQADSLKSARKKLISEEFDVVICDVKLPDGNGVEFIESIKEKQPFAEIILLTAYGNIADGVQSIKNGAFDYITKGDDNNKIIPLLHRAFEKAQLAKRVQQLEKQVAKKYNFDSIIGRSPAIIDAINWGKKVAQGDTTVLLLGETGTGKEVFAQAIHQASNRNKRNFVALNCAAFGRELLESELFGHKAGSFTGALKDKKGLFEEANGGTLFLDEIGEMAVDLQAKLLRVLEMGEFLKIGETEPTKVDVRIVAATNRQLEDEIEKGTFRSDLYYRLSVFTIFLPPLRERKQDIALLANNFAEVFALKTNKRIVKLSHTYLQALEHYPWKGNIRELKNVIERSVILDESGVLNVDSLPYEVRHPELQHTTVSSNFSLESMEKLHIQKVLAFTHGNKAEAARLLDIGIATLYRKIEQYKI
ncbi:MULTISPECIES: sigma-54-dependent transcriptional regulator [Olivibacter]|uniref:Sigma-54-dependent transcriptional regulator n=2 Tax=Olivibacter TaxID=376469 RepID=A0ABV6HMV8_9SPHI|nr:MULTISPECIES: sigma-54 dependent transcriptional regulator [Olivibacter]MCL4638989.1 sigma-54 dependent transcriptional regulator [Olivibacter sp. UJ_SKK_5.1]MDX3915590.1 sigma-54 dependent transcriptional regulator [Pseudosphingobacterium sp.]QEL02780.1 sigma-54-dependent Fis family transcriptional regulator [Olivibacter sp. LS-1]